MHEANEVERMQQMMTKQTDADNKVCKLNALYFWSQ